MRVKVTRGQHVKQGEILGELDPEIAEAQVAQAEAAVAAAEAQAQIAADVAQRNQKLETEGSVSDLANKTSGAQAKQAEAQLRSARAQLAQARAVLKRQVLRAPFAGLVVEAPDQVGATVSVGIPLFTVEALDTLTLRTTIPEEARAQLKVGDQVEVRSIGARAETAAATIRRILPSADPATRRIPLEIAVPNADLRFVAHTLARATLSRRPGRAQVEADRAGSIRGDHVAQ